MSPNCHLCGSAELADDCAPGSAVCNDCTAIRDHVVSMQRGKNGEALAICPCGWRYQSQFNGVTGSIFREVAVRAHWRAMIAAAAMAVQS